MKLRPYQQECLENIVSEARQGVVRQIMVLSTGSGKTIIFGHLPSKVRAKGKKTLILAHREELLSQTKEKLLMIDSTLKIGVEQAEKALTIDEIKDLDVILASVPTIGRKDSERIKKFNPEDYGLIIVDECVLKDTFVSCQGGYKLIQDVKRGDLVWTVNEKTKELELKFVLKVIKKKRQRNIVQIGNLRCTDNHKIYTNKGWKEAKDIDKREIKTIQDFHSKVNIDSILFGCLLGDSGVDYNTGRINFGHTEKNLDYLEWKHSIFSKRYALKKIKKFNNNAGYGNNYMYKFNINDKKLSNNLKQKLLRNKRRVVSRELLDGLGSEGLAVWVQDDGCCVKNQIIIGTYRYGKAGNKKILKWFRKEYGIKGKLMRDNRRKERYQYFIKFFVEESLKIYSLIFPFLAKSMLWKFSGLAEKHSGVVRKCVLCGNRIQHLKNVFPTMQPQVKYCNRPLCVKVKQHSGVKFYVDKGLDNTKKMYNYLLNKNNSLEDESEYVYDLTVKDNHNYFADGILVHNCHRAVSSTFLNVFRYFDVLKGEVKKPNGRILLGCTATPTRADKVGLDKVFDKIVFNYGLRQAIDEGYLCDIKAYNVKTQSDLSNVSTCMGDFAEGELAEEVNTEHRNRLIVESYKEIADNTKALAFAVNVEHAYDLCGVFKKYGYTSEVIVGETEKNKRRRLLQEYKDGEIDVLVNVGVFVEGVDIPSIETILMARPTKSSVLFSQAVGRGSRLYKDKEHMNLIDFVDNTGKNSVMGLPTLFGMSKNLKSKGRRITEVVDKAEKILEVNPSYDVETIEDWSDENIDKIIKRVDIFAQAELPLIVKQNSRYAWHKHLEEYRIQFPKEDCIKETIFIKPNMLNRFEIIVESYAEIEPTYQNGYKKWRKESKEKIGIHNAIFDAFKEGDKWITQNKSSFKTMMNQNSSWRSEQPTEKQLSLLKKLNVPVPKGISKGQASTLISKCLDAKDNN